jgi:hypothetical protein
MMPLQGINGAKWGHAEFFTRPEALSGPRKSGSTFEVVWKASHSPE